MLNLLSFLWGVSAIVHVFTGSDMGFYGSAAISTLFLCADQVVRAVEGR